MTNRTTPRFLPLLIAPMTALAAGCASAPSAEGPLDGRPEQGDEREGQRQRGPMTPAQKAAMRVTRLEVSPDTLRLKVGATGAVEVVARDSAGEVVDGVQVQRFLRGRTASYDAASGRVEGVEPGQATLVAMVQRPPRGPGEEPERIVARARVIVEPLPVVRVEITPPGGAVYAGTRVRVEARAFSEARRREDARIAWTSSDPSVARLNPHGLLQGGEAGTATVTATSEGVEASVEVEVASNPVRDVELTAPEEPLEVGRPLRLEAVARDGSGEPVADAPVEWTVEGPHGAMSEGAYLDDEGRFVAEEPGLFFVTATVGERSSTVELEAEPGFRRRPMEVVGHGAVTGRTTSDLWVFRGVDGGDYAYTGTHAAGAGGNVMYAWDVSDPTDPVITDSVVVDARVVNDVKINETRNLAVITREGASDRRNGIVLLDIRVPAHPRIVSSFTENLTAGVHNVWIEGHHVYAVNDGTRALHIVDISDPSEPRHVGRWQLENENRSLHDVIVQDGLAYLSYWDDGLVILDVGRGIEGGTPTEPRMVSQFVYRGRFGAETYGNTHHAIPYGDYVFVGDEIFGCEECVNGPRGYVHVIDVSDLRDPEEVAWYRVPEAGTHNLWVEDGKLYVAYYQGGVRVVDISGELRGDLYRQGREIGWSMTETGSTPRVSEEDAFRPNHTMAWGPQPYDGHLYVADMSSGLWILEFADEEGDGGS